MSLFRSSLSRQGLVIIAVPLLLSFLFLAGLKLLLDDAQLQAEREAHSRQILTAANALGNSMVFTISDYLLDSMTPAAFSQTRYQSAIQRAKLRMSELETLLPPDGPQRSLVGRMRSEFEETFKLFSAQRTTQEFGPAEKAEQSRAIKSHTNSLLSDIRRLVEYEEAQLKEKGRTFSAYGKLIDIVLLLAVILNMVLAAVLMLAFGRNISQRLSVVIDNSDRLVEGRELNQPVAGNDEIGRLDSALHETAVRLKEARRRERAIVENAREVICSLNNQGRLVEVNQACITAWGYKPEEILQGPIARIIHDPDQDLFHDKLNECSMQQQSLSFECRMITGSGILKDVLWSMQWSEADNKIFCVVLDITERKRAEDALKQSEERMRSVFEMMPLALFVMSNEGDIISANPAAEQHFVATVSDLGKRKVNELFSFDKTGDKTIPFGELMSPPLNPLRKIYGKRLVGDLFPAEVMSTAYDTSDFNGRLLIVKDVSREYEADRLKKSFIAMVGHELKSPLMSIHVCLEMLGKGFLGDLSEEGDLSVKSAEESVQRLISLVNEILDAEKLESGSISINPQLMNLNDAFDQAAGSVAALAERQKIRIERDIANFELSADSNRIVQVLVNLLSNAIKFSPPNSKISLIAKDAGSEVEISVVDSGRGVPHEHQQLIFERFHQVMPGDAKEKGGTGLGLAICKAIAEAHGGNIGVESNSSTGSRFWFTLSKKKPISIIEEK